MKEGLALLIAPAQAKTSLTSSVLGLLEELSSIGVKVAYYKPIAEKIDKNRPELIESIWGIKSPEPLVYRVSKWLDDSKYNEALNEHILHQYQLLQADYDVVLIEGVSTQEQGAYSIELNEQIAQNLAAKIVLVSEFDLSESGMMHFESEIRAAVESFGGFQSRNVIGAIVNKVGMPPYWKSDRFFIGIDETSPLDKEAFEAVAAKIEANAVFKQGIKLLGVVPWLPSLATVPISRLVEEAGLTIISPGDQTRRIRNLLVITRPVQTVLSDLNPGTLVLTGGDRDDVILAAAMMEMQGQRIGGLLLTTKGLPNPETMKLCQAAFDLGLPVLSTEQDTYNAIVSIGRKIAFQTSALDKNHALNVRRFVTDYLKRDAVKAMMAQKYTKRLSPGLFRYELFKQASSDLMRIVLPESQDIRILEAASIIMNKKIAECILIGDPDVVQTTAKGTGLELPEGLKIMRPAHLKSRYVNRLIEIRKHKGMNEALAHDALEESITLGTMMLEGGQVDGLVAGAVNTTASTILPAFRLIKTKPECSVISSVFFMCLRDQVLVYGDCAVNPNPTAEQLAEIAFESAATARGFGIEPKIAMISYSTGDSGSGEDVDKVREATRLLLERKPDFPVDGPIQYDAAVSEIVAQKKAPKSNLKGQANVFIFPDLNTGNTTYKAVQRSASAISIGPVLQGLRRPVNDLSRGALVDDIVYTIAITAIQAQQVKSS